MSSCDSQPGLIPFAEALTRLLKSVETIAEVETISLQHAAGRVLAENLTAGVSVPPADNSAMDGYALNCDDLQASGGRLRISQRIAAGMATQPLEQGTCARIFTGAEIPTGANTVVMQEDTRVEGDWVVFATQPKAGDNVRGCGQDIAQGEQIMTVGTKLEPAHLGVLASVGLAEISVFKPIKVAILSTGDELVELGQPLQQGQIYNSNRYILKGLLKNLGMQAVDMGCVEDTRAATEAALLRASEQADMIITTGGVSVGEEDHVKGAVEALGSLDMWKVKIKPGKPLAYGQVKGTPFMGLPGNPSSTLITFCLFARPCLQRLQGESVAAPLQFPVSAGFTRGKGIQRQEYLRVRVEQGRLVPHNNQSSGVLSSASWAHGLAVIPPHTSVAEGDLVAFMPFSELLH